MMDSRKLVELQSNTEALIESINDFFIEEYGHQPRLKGMTGFQLVSEVVNTWLPPEYDRSFAKWFRNRCKSDVRFLVVDSVERYCDKYQITLQATPPVGSHSLDPKDQEILRTMYALSAISSDTRATQDAIAVKADPSGLDTGEAIKQRMSKLSKLDYVKSKTGRGGGCWLTKKGKETVENGNTV